ncbi:MAG TPA: DUF2147 domain-containing protein [Gammaproteobacteria bacterium]|nr:DUF2147 domain-containing protein [Gammaproteobacteria bacterium]
MTRIFVPIVLFCALLTSTGYAAGPTDAGADAILGTWVTEGGKAHVAISRAAGAYQGRIVWLKEPDYPVDDKQGMGGQAKVDRENPDAGLRNRPIIGLALVSGFHYAGDGVWTDGTIYDPESGKTYRCKITLRKDGSLNVRGYVGFSLFGRTTVWTRLAATPGNARPK